MRKFKRSTQSIVTTILLVIALSYTVAILIVGCAEVELFGFTTFLTELGLVLQLLFFLVATIIADSAMPPDFEYFINVSKDWVFFEFSQEDHRMIAKNFIISNKTRHYIILDDGLSRICIAYNKEVLQFLKEINN